VIADCLENQFTSHDLCDENHKRQVEGRVQVLFTSVDDTSLGKVRPCDIHKLGNSLKLRKACVLDGIPNECLRHLPRRPLVHLTHLFNHCLRLSHFLSLGGAQRHTEERGLLNASQFGFHAGYSKTLQCMILMDHLTSNFKINMSTAAVFLDIEKAFDMTWHLGLVYKLLELKFSVSVIKLISSFLSHRKFRVLVEGEISVPRDIQAVLPLGSVPTPTLCSIYINDMPQISGVYLGVFVDDTCIYATDCRQGYVLRKLH
jgi:hypothetical protein